MGNSFRKAFDRLFGNREMRVGGCTANALQSSAAPTAFEDYGLYVSRRSAACHAGRHAWTGRSGQDNHSLQAAHWGDSQHCADHWWATNVDLTGLHNTRFSCLPASLVPLVAALLRWLQAQLLMVPSHGVALATQCSEQSSAPHHDEGIPSTDTVPNFSNVQVSMSRRCSTRMSCSQCGMWAVRRSCAPYGATISTTLTA